MLALVNSKQIFREVGEVVDHLLEKYGDKANVSVLENRSELPSATYVYEGVVLKGKFADVDVGAAESVKVFIGE